MASSDILDDLLRHADSTAVVELPPLVDLDVLDAADPFRGAAEGDIIKQLKDAARKQGWQLNANGGDRVNGRQTPYYKRKFHCQQTQTYVSQPQSPHGLAHAQGTADFKVFQP